MDTNVPVILWDPKRLGPSPRTLLEYLKYDTSDPESWNVPSLS